MCKKEKDRLLEHIEKAIYRIDKIQEICKEFDNIEQALQNEDTQLIIIKCIDILYEKLMKFKSYGIAKDMYDTLSRYYIENIKETRIISSHDFDELEFDKITNIITNDLPYFRAELQNIIDNFDTFEIHIETEIDEINKEISKKERQIETQKTKIAELKERLNKLQNEPSADAPNDDTPPPPSQGTKHKR